MVKQLLMKAPILVPLIDREPLLLYVVATTQVVNATLVVEREEKGHTLKVQHPMYFISEVLSDSKTLYLQIQKLLYAILIAKSKLRHYIKSHPMMVVTSFPQRGCPKLGCHGKNHEVGTRAVGSRHLVCLLDSHQVPSAG